MDVTLELNGKKVTAKVSFAQPDDFKFAKSWKESIGNDQNPVRVDTVEYAQQAVKKYEASFGSGKYANSLKDFSDHIASNPKVEVGGFVVLRCTWFPGAEVIGFSHFRRTWCNKIVLDYLGTHPLIVRPQDNATHKVRGVGVALLYFVAQVLKQENCSALWGEATGLSASFYQKVFNLQGVEDLIHAPRENVIAFLDESEREWSAESEVIAAADQLLEQIYELETNNPPFVGIKTAVFNQSKRLAYRYLKLPYHKQVEIAKILNFIKADAAIISKDDLAQLVFKGAREKDLLSTLWNLVEKEHGDGTPEENPFELTQK